MRSLRGVSDMFLLLLLVLSSTVSPATVSAVNSAKGATEFMWRDFLEKFPYKLDEYGVNNKTEFEYRRSVFFRRHDPKSTAPEAVELRELMKENPDANFGVTQFSDFTLEELEARRHRGGRLVKNFRKHLRQDFRKVKNTETEHHPPAGGGELFNEEIKRCNWTEHGVVGRVLNQKNCGGCWAFASSENIASQWALQGHPYRLLSAQQLISCDTRDYGCDGSYRYQDTLRWIKEENNGTLATWDSYPFLSGDGQSKKCEDKTRHLEIGARGIDHGVIPHESRHPAELAQYMYHRGPVQISISTRHLSFYTGGIISHGSHCKTGQIDHEVLLTGFDFAHSPKYWIVKNSWGEGWGESGYFRIEFEPSKDLDCITAEPWMFQLKKEREHDATGAAAEGNGNDASLSNLIRHQYLAKRDAWNDKKTRLGCSLFQC